MSTGVIDHAVFDELRATTGDEFVQELVDTFAEEAPGLLAAIGAAHACGSADDFRRAAHSLKSNALTFGAVKLGRMARELEQGGLPPGAGFEAKSLGAALDEALATLKELCRG